MQSHCDIQKLQTGTYKRTFIVYLFAHTNLEIQIESDGFQLIKCFDRSALNAYSKSSLRSIKMHTGCVDRRQSSALIACA